MWKREAALAISAAVAEELDLLNEKVGEMTKALACSAEEPDLPLCKRLGAPNLSVLALRAVREEPLLQKLGQRRGSCLRICACGC